MARFSSVITLSLQRAFTAIVLLGLFVFSPNSFAIDVITHNDVLEEELTSIKLRAIFSGRVKQWQNGKPVIVVMLGYHDPLHIQFCNQTLGVYPRHILRSWERSVFSGTGRKPIIVKTEQELIKTVKDTPNAVGYVETAENLEGIDVIKIK